MVHCQWGQESSRIYFRQIGQGAQEASESTQEEEVIQFKDNALDAY
jgi:hypothetical protein